MSMSHRSDTQQNSLWVAHDEIPRGPGHAFYDKVNEVLRKRGFDTFVEAKCAKFYAKNKGRPSIPPGVYFRMLFVGYFEGIGEERRICWRVADSLSLRDFVGIPLSETVPNHSSMTRIRQRIDVDTMELVFQWIIQVLREAKVLKGMSIGIDATNLEASASMRSLVRRENGLTYKQYIHQLAEEECEEEGEDGPDDKEARRRDRKREKKTSNKEWKSPTDPDAGIARMKNGTTRVAYKAEHGVDMDSGAIVAVTVSAGPTGDSESLKETLEKSIVATASVTGNLPKDLVADAGYDSDAVYATAELYDMKAYVAKRKVERKWEDGSSAAKQRYEKSSRLSNNSRGKRLQRARGEKVERTFQHVYDRGGMRRLSVRGQENVRKRLLLQAAGHNLALLMRALGFGGSPKSRQSAFFILLSITRLIEDAAPSIRWNYGGTGSTRTDRVKTSFAQKIRNHAIGIKPRFSTAC